ncbi:MAG: hypothetical protein JST52_06585 [Bacteroidetes bacterium]|nr:hypothetical protein [Bacteroidota bacterium]MBS1741342.1 hypothetical protein [Bacteroidota bacterium]
MNRVVSIEKALQPYIGKKPEWTKQTTAILVYHGIGNQLPIETIDQFGNGLVEGLQKIFGNKITLSHQLVDKEADGKYWFDNVLRISHEDYPNHYIDIYEYYWANLTEDKASWKDLNQWLQGVVNGAKRFYKRNAELGQLYKDRSIFFDSKTGAFKDSTYRFFLGGALWFFRLSDWFARAFLRFVRNIPGLGNAAASMLESYGETMVHKAVNVMGDVAVYNVSDPKNKFYSVRKQILDGGMKALQFIIERNTEEKNSTKHLYNAILIAGHSLGSQVAYDSINRINLLANQNKLKDYFSNGLSKHNDPISLQDRLKGFITFGSPLDKIVFFLRENIPSKNYIRQQLLAHYHGFKIKPLDNLHVEANKHTNVISCNLQRLFDQMQWRNYFDKSDYVSGSLDYYYDLTNVDCKYNEGTFAFTHSRYWDDPRFFKDIILYFLTQ